MSETVDISNVSSAVTTWDEPTANLRWNEGILEQLVIVFHATSGVLHTKKNEWRPVPRASS